MNGEIAKSRIFPARQLIILQYAYLHIYVYAHYILCGIDRDLPMFLRRHAAADDPFADARSPLCLSLPGNSWRSANQGVPAPRLSAEEANGQVHPLWHMEDL
jgi:hypothetical protein